MQRVSLLTLVEQIILGVHENTCCNHDMPQRLYTVNINNGERGGQTHNIFERDGAQ